jgi:hypothetical protein
MPVLTAITEALPWTQILRDLQLLGKQGGTMANLWPVVEIATELHAAHGYADAFIEWLRCRLGTVARECSRNESLHPQIQAAIRDSADRALPRRRFWDALDESLGCLNAPGPDHASG